MTAAPAAATAAPRGQLLGVLRHRDFALFIAAASISNGGSWLQNVAVPALLFDLTGKATWLGISSMATLLPAMLLTPYAGVLADRVSRRLILLITQSVMMISSTALWLMYRADRLTPWWIVGLGLLTGIASGFQVSTWQSFVPLLVPQRDMLEAVRLNSLQFTLARALGPGIAGVVLATWGTGAAILINVVTYPLVLAVLVFTNPRPSMAVSRAGSVLGSLRDGGRYVWRTPATRLAVIFAFVTAMLGQPPHHIGAAVAAQVFGRPSKDSALFLAALGIGALSASGLISRLIARWRRATLVRTACLLYAVGLVMMAATRDFRVGLAAYFVGGIGHLTCAMSLNTIVQSSVPDELRGRVMSFYVLGILGGIPIGSFVVARLADTIGMRPALLLAAGLLTTITLVATATGSLRQLDPPSGAVPA